MTELDPFEHDDAAYVLGALDPDDARAFAAHLAGCAACTARVDALRGTAGALAGLDAEDVADLDSAGPVPESLLPGLARRLAGRQRRRRWGTAALSGLAAAALIALAVVLGTGSDGGPAPSAGGRAMTTVGTAVPVRATADLDAQSWGTRIVLDCRYAAAAAPGYPATYSLQVVDRDGRRQVLGSWTLAAGTDTRFVSGTATPLAQIRLVQITGADGRPVLQLAAG